ncbi:MAG: dihydrolipoyl dehydrogenase [Rubrivivax sp.]
MKTLQTDVAVIGAGTAGMTAFRSALEHTGRALLIEGGPYGTTCARVGCMPSKLLIAAADAAHAVQTAPLFGVHAGGAPRIDGAAVMQRVKAERDRFVGFVVESVERWPAAQRVHGHARFVDDHTLQVDAHTRIEAARIVIATGASPALPPPWRTALGDRLLVNDDVFDWDTLPASLAVIGTGIIGLELAQALHRLGVRVKLYGRDGKVGPLTDPALQEETRRLIADALPMDAHADHLTVRRDGDTVVVSCTGQGDERFDALLAATGRRPNVDQIGLEHTTLPRDASGVPSFDRRTGQIGRSHVFLAGDVGERHPLLHEAADDGRIAGDNAGRWPDLRVHPRRAALAIVFSDPQIMLAGRSHATLVDDGTAFETGAVSFEDQGRSRVMAKNRGRLHVYGERGSGRFLGAEMIGPAAEHLGHLLAWSAQRGDTVQQMLDCPYYHPVIEEGLRTALRELQRALRMGPPPVERCMDCGPGA